MPRKLRLEFAGACYHVYNRGNYRRPIFATPGAADSFQACLDETCIAFGWLVHAFIIMGNHFHLGVETPEPNLSLGMKWLQGTWAQRFNRFRGTVGRPFQGRYKAGHVERGHALAQVAHYIHLNPVQAQIVGANSVGDYRWSSLALFPDQNRPSWLVPSIVLSESGRLPDTPAGWRRYNQYLAVLVEEDPKFRDEKFGALAGEWAMGSAEFGAEIRTRMQRAEATANKFGLLGADHEAVVKARCELWEDQLRALAGAFGIPLDTLPDKKSATEKLTLAAAMKQTTSVSKAWLAERLKMGVADSLGPLLHRFRTNGGTAQPAFKAAMSRFLS